MRVLALALLAATACSAPPPLERLAPPPLEELIAIPTLEEVDPSQPVSDSDVEPPSIRFPALDAFEPAVKQQLEARQAALRRALERPGITRGELAEAYGTLGMHYQVYRLRRPAVECYEAARALMPRDPRWAYYQGRVLDDLGRPDAAAQALLAVVAADPADDGALCALASVERQRGRIEAARQLYATVLQRDPTVTAAWYGLGRLQDDPEDAVAMFGEALALDPDAGPVHYAMAMAYRELGREDRVEEHLAEASPGVVQFPDPRSAELFRLATGRGVTIARSASASDQGRHELAVREYARLVEADPDDAWARVSLGTVLEEAGRPDEARAQFEKAVGLDPDHIQANLRLGAVLADLRRWAEAEPRLRKALEVDPEELEAHLELGGVLLGAGRAAAAVPHLERVAAEDPGNVDGHLALAEARARDGRYEEAIEGLAPAQQAMPAAPPLATALARYLAAAPDPALRDGERALALIESVGGERSRTLEQARVTAMAHAATGDYGEAVRWQQQVLDAARRLDRGALLPLLERHLQAYREGRPCDEPWLP